MLIPSDLCNFLVLILAGMRLKDRRLTTSAREFERVIAIMNLITIA